MAIRLSSSASLVHFSSSDGLRIEGRLTKASADRAVVLCHPHPLYGGSMLTPVIMTAEQAFQEAGYTTLAFNFRGVGGSEGTYGEGPAEVADVIGALDHLEEALGARPKLHGRCGILVWKLRGGDGGRSGPARRVLPGHRPAAEPLRLWIPSPSDLPRRADRRNTRRVL